MRQYDPKRRWLERRGLPCRTLDTDAFFVGGNRTAGRPGPRVQAEWNELKETCTYCPVLAECQRDTLGEEYGVWGGRDQWERFKLRKALAEEAKGWGAEHREEWAREVYRLRHEGGADDLRTFQEIRTLTGLPVALAQQLCVEEEGRLQALEASEKPKQAAAAEAVAEAPELPETPGRRHLWVRHHAIVRDAYYKAHSEDGTHVLVEMRDGRALTRTWLPLDDTRFYTDQERVTKEMKGRYRYGARRKRDGYDAAA